MSNDYFRFKGFTNRVGSDLEGDQATAVLVYTLKVNLIYNMHSMVVICNYSMYNKNDRCRVEKRCIADNSRCCLNRCINR